MQFSDLSAHQQQILVANMIGLQVAAATLARLTGNTYDSVYSGLVEIASQQLERLSDEEIVSLVKAIDSQIQMAEESCKQAFVMQFSTKIK